MQLSDLDRIEREEQEGMAGDKGFLDMEKIGRDCLRLTNEFRAKNNLSPLKWSSALHEIALVHSLRSFLFIFYILFAKMYYLFYFSIKIEF